MIQLARPKRNKPDTPASWRSGFLAELDRSAVRGRWGRALQAVGAIHLISSLICQVLYDPAIIDDMRHPVVWAFEVLALVLAFRLASGPGWYRANPATALIARVWVTFLILTLSVATTNSLTGWGVDWYKLAWCTLSSFGFATTAWLVDLRFLIFAFQMYGTAQLMVRFPTYGYTIYGVSWFLALQVIGLTLQRRRARRLVA